MNRPVATDAREVAGDLLGVWMRAGHPITERLEAARARLPDPRERALATELVLGTVRTSGSIDAVLRRVVHRPIAQLNRAVHVALRLGAYQVLYLDRVPDHAALDTAVGWASRHAGARRAGFVNGALRGLLSAIEERRREGKGLHPLRDLPRGDGTCVRFKRQIFPDPDQEPARNRAERWSMPTWLVARWLDRFGPDWTDGALAAGLGRPPIVCRARGARAALQAQLEEAGIAYELGAGPAAIVLPTDAALGTWYDEGLVAVQDATSQVVAPLLDPQPGERVLDLCAAPGGKTLHMADLMGRGAIVATDVDADRLVQVEALRPHMRDVALDVQRVEREGPLPFAEASFDRVLVDAPCTNTGVLRRRVEVRWRLRPADIAALAAIQFDLLARVVPLLRPGGTLVYSTCSVEPEENEEVVARFLAAHGDFREVEARRHAPSRASDGGFAVRLARS